LPIAFISGDIASIQARGKLQALLQLHPSIYFSNKGEDRGSRIVSRAMDRHSKFLLSLDRANAATEICSNFLPGLQRMPLGAPWINERFAKADGTNDQC